jgi:hypothetical protein
LVSISRHLAKFDELGWKVITQKGIFLELGPSSFVGIQEVSKCSLFDRLRETNVWAELSPDKQTK